MPSDNTAHIGENSPEQVAYKMTERVLTVIEGKNWRDIKRKEFLDTYAECLKAVTGRRKTDADKAEEEALANSFR